MFWKGDAAAEAAVKKLVEKNRSLGETILKAIKSTIDKLNALSWNTINALKTEVRGKWLEELTIFEKAQEMWTDALMNPEIDEFEDAVNNDDEIKFMYKGKNEEGIEVYSVTSKTQKMKPGEKNKTAKRKIEKDVLNEKVIFNTGKEKYSAKIDNSFIGKNVYGDNQTKGAKAQEKKISLLAEGDTLELLQNMTYSHSSTDNNNKHKEVLEWDYFTKRVIIGKTEYNLLANIKKTKKENFVYNIKFEKNNRASNGRIAQANASDLKNPEIRSVDDNLPQVTSEVKKFFKESKIRDESGTLKVLYHGTDSDFNIFKMSEFGGKTGHANGYGIYLSGSKETAEAYGSRVLEVYANIKNPAYGNKKTLKIKDVERLVEKSVEMQAQELVEDGYDTISEAKKDTWIPNYIDTYSKGSFDEMYKEVATFLMKEDNDADIIDKVINAMGIYSYAEAERLYNEILILSTGFHVIIMTEANSSVNKRVLGLLPKIKTRKINSPCIV